MKRSLRDEARFATRRRGVTLVEMLVTLAILLLMMTAIVKIFQAATGSLSSAQAYQELDNQLRQLDATIRSDLNGVTARLTPPLNPNNNLGYLEYGENEFADVQGEDSDDYIRFTAKAPAGRPFTGRMWVPPPYPANLTQVETLFQAPYQPITITSDYAEIIYFLRNGNLYRRVLLVAPERQSAVVATIGNSATLVYSGGTDPNPQPFKPAGLGGNTTVSWQGMNDLSAHPAPTGPDPNAPPTHNSVILNTLANLTNRENRWAYQRFANDFQNLALANTPDNVPDDLNGDNVPDYYPSLYGGLFGTPTNQLIFEPPLPNGNLAPGFRPLLAFPYVFPGAYSCPQVLNVNNGSAPYGWIHSPNPQVYSQSANSNIAFDVNPLGYLQGINHNPIDLGDNLPLPGSLAFNTQTWWGFPTWRETLSPSWTDPTVQVNLAQAQPFGLNPRSAGTVPVNDQPPAPPGTLIPPAGDQLLPPMTSAWRVKPQLYTDGDGDNSTFFSATPALWSQSWEDDLIMTGVRSFDIKAYDNSKGDYVDLGWGDDVRITNLPLPASNQTPYLYGNPPGGTFWNLQHFDTLNQTFAHEGRMPPLVEDQRLDAQYPNPTYNTITGTWTAQYSAYPNYSSNIGDDQQGIVRLRRVWDSWSTDYTIAPGTGVYLNNSNATDPLNGFPWGPPYTPPIYPSYPPPYPAPLRGIQIQIRVTDPSNQRIKILTIRQDFTDKL